MSRWKNTLCIVATAVVLPVAAAALILPAFYAPSNCGGNNAAISAVRCYLTIVKLAQDRDPGHPFDVTQATTEERAEFARITASIWNGSARYLVLASPFQIETSGPRRVVIVCDQPFRNVPRRILGRSPPAHAAGFSDGSVELISTADFVALDRSELVPLDAILEEAQ